MTVGLETIPWSVPEYWFYTIFSILNGILFSSLLIMLLVVPKYRKYLKDNIFAGLTLFAIVIESYIKPFVMFELFGDFNEECYEDGNRDCLRCDVAGQLQKLMIILGVTARCFMILQVLENTFQKFKFLAYPQEFILLLKIFLGILCLIYSILLMTEFKFPYHVYQMTDDADIHVCNIAFEDDKAKNPRTFMAVFSSIMLTFQLLFCYLFINKSLVLYRITKDKIDASNYEQVKKTIRKMLHGVIIPIIRHSMIVVTITIGHGLLVVLYKFIQPNEIPLDVVENLIVGLCVMIMFPFGEPCFNMVCGCFERGIVKKWLEMELKALKEKKSKELMNGMDANRRISATGTKSSSRTSHSKGRTTKSSEPKEIALHSEAKEFDQIHPIQLLNREDMEKLALKKEPSREVTMNSITEFSRWGSQHLPEIEIVEASEPKANDS